MRLISIKSRRLRTTVRLATHASAEIDSLIIAQVDAKRKPLQAGGDDGRLRMDSVVRYAHMLELYFAKLLGLYFIIMGVIMLVRRKAMVPTIGQLMNDRAMLFVVAVVELAAGIGLVVAYPVPSLTIAGALSVIGYLMALEGIAYLTMPKRTIQAFSKWVNRSSWYWVYGAAAIALGGALAGVGFGYW